MTEELKPLPCPFCGGAPTLFADSDGWYIRCLNDDKCEVDTGTTVTLANTHEAGIWDKAKQEAIKAWNTRSPAWRDIESAPREDVVPFCAKHSRWPCYECGTKHAVCEQEPERACTFCRPIQPPEEGK